MMMHEGAAVAESDPVRSSLTVERAPPREAADDGLMPNIRCVASVSSALIAFGLDSAVEVGSASGPPHA